MKKPVLAALVISLFLVMGCTNPANDIPAQQLIDEDLLGSWYAFCPVNPYYHVYHNDGGFEYWDLNGTYPFPVTYGSYEARDGVIYGSNSSRHYYEIDGIEKQLSDDPDMRSYVILYLTGNAEAVDLHGTWINDDGDVRMIFHEDDTWEIMDPSDSHFNRGPIYTCDGNELRLFDNDETYLSLGISRIGSDEMTLGTPSGSVNYTRL